MDRIGKALGTSVSVSVKKKNGRQVVVLECRDKKLEIPYLNKNKLSNYKPLCTTMSRIGPSGVLGDALVLELLYCVYLARKNNKEFDSKVAGYIVEPLDQKEYVLKVTFYERRK